ncbi:hypothetical protein SAMN05428995_101702 [Loktanella sp. DSM 29012]|uniref:DUF465 domain-containing protein n=1 Tax=Loktanella gaetbuli TaxID=2881335 RepID=A0ABS8BXF3_9RHOB|nr:MULTISPECIES: DUF465 domain-containing protein [Loktanella]MCB5200375.1 DUF465 domain-containing protein [Loktanella gaetbuli]SEP75346.1 hypothetical protein SAMN05428995_101702 [Loktanella sp. DSM 29012]
MNTSSRLSETEVQRIELGVLRQEHHDLDLAISALQMTHPGDVLTIKRLKRKKLMLKDRIARIEDQLNPDIIA